MRASRLMRDPQVESVDMPLLVGIANAIEQEALKRYAGLAATMQRRGEAATAAALQVMVGEKRRHAEEIAQWAAGLGQPLPAPGSLDWHPPPALRGSPEEISGSALLTPYRAFAIAVDDHESAFALYAYLAARAGSQRVRLEAERLGLRELRHASLMRRRRREAWHLQRRAAHGQRSPEPEAITSAAALSELLARREAAIARVQRAVAGRLRASGRDADARLLESLLATPSARPAEAPEVDVQIPDTDDPLHLMVAAQRPLEALSEELEAVIGTAQGALFEQGEAALVNVLTRLARIAMHTAHATQRR